MKPRSPGWIGGWVLLAMVALVLVPSPSDASPFLQEADPQTQAEALFAEGSALFESGQWKAGLGKFEAALRFYQAAGDGRGEGICLLAIGSVYEQLEDYDGAFQAYESSRQIWQESFPKEEWGWTILLSIGTLYAEHGQYEQALQAFEQAAEAAHTLENRESEFFALSWVSTLHAWLGQCELGLEVADQAMAIAEEPNEVAEAWGLGRDIGLCYFDVGQYELALLVFQQWLDVARQLPDQEAIGWILSYMGMVYADIGQGDSALEVYQEALKVAIETEDKPLEANVLNNMGTIHVDLEEYEQALALFEQALTIELDVENPGQKGVILDNLGAVYGEMRRFAEALACRQQALAIARDSHNPKSEGTALGNIGSIYADMGRYEEALGAYDQALAAFGRTVDPMGEGWMLLEIGVVYDEMGQYDQALAFYVQGIDAIETVQRDVTVEELGASFVAEWLPYYEAVISLYQLAGQSAEAFSYTERARAQAFLRQVGNQQVDYRRGATPGLIAEEQALRQRIAALEKTLAEELDLPYGDQSQELLQQLTLELEETYADHGSLLTRLKLESPEYASLVSVNTLSLEQVQEQVLDEDTTLIEYFVLDDQTLAWVIDQESFKLVALQIGRDELRNRVKFLVNLTLKREYDPQVAAGLYDALFAPLKPHIRHPNLVIVPHGVLHYLPFAALWDAKIERFLVEDYAITYAPSASALKFIRAKRNPDQGRLLALGNPDGSLLHAEAEAEVVAELYGAAPLLRQAAVESQVYAQAGQIDVLHLAAHGEYNPHNALYSRIVLAPDETEDGNLEMHEVFGLDLSGANLVVLSACQTALGEQSAGDELVGLTRAFLYAGTPAVVTTLWSIDDAASEALMKAFYGHLREGLMNAEALRAAQLEVMSQEGWREPSYWAAFSLTGDYRGNSESRMAVESVPRPAEASRATPTVTVAPAAAAGPPPGRAGGGLCGGSAAMPLGLATLVGLQRLRTRRRTRS